MKPKEKFAKYYDLVKKHARPLSYKLNIEYDDALGYGAFGLWQACLKPEAKDEIEKQWLAYAHIKIKGAIRDGARKIRGAIKQPPHMVSYELLAIEKPYYIVSILKDEHVVMPRLQKAIAKLPPREKEVIYKSYFLDETLKDIGKSYGVTEAWTSITRTRAIKKIQESLAA